MIYIIKKKFSITDFTLTSDLNNYIKKFIRGRIYEQKS